MQRSLGQSLLDHIITNNKTNKEFIKDRAKRILVPSVIGIFVYGWISGWTTNYYGDIFAGNGNMIPGPIKYLIFSLIFISAGSFK